MLRRGVVWWRGVMVTTIVCEFHATATTPPPQWNHTAPVTTASATLPFHSTTTTITTAKPCHPTAVATRMDQFIVKKDGMGAIEYLNHHTNICAFNVLGVDAHGFSNALVRKNYRLLSLLVHPDKHSPSLRNEAQVMQCHSYHHHRGTMPPPTTHHPPP